MVANTLRDGNFTSSEIVALTTNGREKGSFGKPFFTYVEECNFERRLGRSISEDIYSRPTSWGTLLESRCFNILGTDYKLCSQETIGHPDIDCWFGSPDAQKFDEGGTVVDFKCPMTLKSFCQLVQPLYDSELGATIGLKAMQLIRDNHKDGDKYYWQLVSNAILTKSKFAELIVYCPYKSELEAIREFAANNDLKNQHRFFWIVNALDEELPYLPDGGYYNNINVIRFEVPQADKDLLTARVKAGQTHLIKR